MKCVCVCRISQGKAVGQRVTATFLLRRAMAGVLAAQDRTAGSEISARPHFRVSPCRPVVLLAAKAKHQPRPVPAHALHSTASAAPRVHIPFTCIHFSRRDKTPLSSRPSATDFTHLHLLFRMFAVSLLAL